MDFDKAKEKVLSREDKSRKGSVDIQISELVDAINSLEDYYTTSSCAGRILIMRKAHHKRDCEWLLASHEPVPSEELKKAVEELPEGKVWFKMEPMIIHVACRDVEAAVYLIAIAKELGLKRSGIITVGKNIIVEIIGNQSLETIISNDGRLLFGEDYLLTLLDEANSKLETNKDNIDCLCARIKDRKIKSNK